MAVVNLESRTMTLKIVYYGCAVGGKTTNLELLQHMTDRDNTSGLVSIATQDDRTLFFDLLPMDLGQIGGLRLKAKIYTVPGQSHYEATRRQVLNGADGLVLVVDSSPQAQNSNDWAMRDLRLNLRANNLDPNTIPMVLQWNKRDLPNAIPVPDLRRQLNQSGLPEFEAVATTGQGVVETFAGVLKATIIETYAKSGRAPVSDEQVHQTVDHALSAAKDSGVDRTLHRFELDPARHAGGKAGSAPADPDAATLGMAVSTNMMLAEKIDEFKDIQRLSERWRSMTRALVALAPRLADASAEGLPKSAMADLLQGAGREAGSLLLFAPEGGKMIELEALPEGSDPLNAVINEGLGSVADRLCRQSGAQLIVDVASDIFFGAPPPGAQNLASALIIPLACAGEELGGLMVYTRLSDPGFDTEEQGYWIAAASLFSMSLHWRGLRQKKAQPANA